MIGLQLGRDKNLWIDLEKSLLNQKDNRLKQTFQHNVIHFLIFQHKSQIKKPLETVRNSLKCQIRHFDEFLTNWI